MATEDKRIDQLDPVSVMDLTSLLAMQQGNNAKKVTLQQLLDYLMSQIDAGNAVLFISQTLSDAQKEQARANIGAAAIGEGGGSAEGAVLFVAQNLTDEQKAQARKNIRCGSVGNVYEESKASGAYSHAEGYTTTASGPYSHAEGHTTTASGYYSHAEGNNAKATSDCSHAEGHNTTASQTYSHAEGFYSKAEGNASHAEGYGARASKRCSHAEGHYSEANGEASHAEGYSSKAEGSASHAEGQYTNAFGAYSHAEGYSTSAWVRSSHVEGEYNIPDPEADDCTQRGKYVHIVGNGTADDARSNAHTLDWEGNAWYAGSVEGTAMILKSPGGKRFSITVNDSGSLTAEEIV